MFPFKRLFKEIRTRFAGLFLTLALVLQIACSSTALQGSLYEQLGGERGVDTLIYQLLLNIAADERIAPRFKGVNIERFRQGLAVYLCSVSEGGCRYEGDSLRVIHAGHYYTDTEFNALVENLIKAMDQCSIPIPTQNRLLAKLAPSYADVVYH